VAGKVGEYDYLQTECPRRGVGRRRAQGWRFLARIFSPQAPPRGQEGPGAGGDLEWSMEAVKANQLLLSQKNASDQGSGGSKGEPSGEGRRPSHSEEGRTINAEGGGPRSLCLTGRGPNEKGGDDVPPQGGVENLFLRGGGHGPPSDGRSLDRKCGGKSWVNQRAEEKCGGRTGRPVGGRGVRRTTKPWGAGLKEGGKPECKTGGGGKKNRPVLKAGADYESSGGLVPDGHAHAVTSRY